MAVRSIHKPECLLKRCEMQRCRSKLQLRKSETLKDAWKGKNAAHFFPKGRGSQRCAVPGMSLWCNPGYIIAASHAVAEDRGTGLIMCFSALSEKGLSFALV